MQTQIRLGYVTIPDAQSILSWSGTMFYMAKALEKEGVSIDYIGSLDHQSLLFEKIKKVFYQGILKKRYLIDRSPHFLRGYAKQIHNILSQKNVDVLLSPGTLPLACLESNKLLVTWNDCTFAGLVDFYSYTSNLCQESIKNGHSIEKSVLERVDLAIFSSEWAARTAIENYSVDPSKVKVVSYGANIECDHTLQDINLFIDSREEAQCKLLFIGVDWIRKGGDISLSVAKRLNEMGIRTELIVVGCKPEVDEPLPEFVQYLGFINKNTSEGRLKIDNLLRTSHFLILPSRADCTPMVLCEANSFGVPCVSTRVGGIPTTIRDDKNGKLFSQSASVEEYCYYIAEIFTDYERYKELAVSSFSEYDSRLNWSTSSKVVRDMLFELVDSTF